MGVLKKLMVAAIALFLFCIQVTNAESKPQDAEDSIYIESTIASKNPVEIFARQLAPGTCTDSTPCATGACCNKSGFCGIGSTFCDPSICVSNCNATAASVLECGVGATNPTCPLNVCCSQYGFCGVTSDFCGTGCQSNCIQPPATTFNNGSVQDLVIGYWQAWSLDSTTCSKRRISDVPVDSLTHLNVAFGYIFPGTFEIYPIPGVSEEDIADLTNLKHLAPGLKMYWLSLGGWDYSDNNTATQPVFGNLASTEGNRQKFIGNLMRFMQQFGFDGVDLDWEYPGAPDRGGSIDDTANYVLLVQDIQTAFANYRPGTSWGLSFTAPTSYWYLRWFDINKMYQYVDWINLMTYDLHGSWDSPSDDIGSFIFAHTNWTEIESALDLFWRNAVPANQINLGLGFYARTYSIPFPFCVFPGCPFYGPGLPGPCTGVGGVLSFDEVTAIRKNLNPNIVLDPIAAVNYFGWGQFPFAQWASFDDVITLQLKVERAQKLGLLGLFIWSIDLDTSDHAALNAVLYPTGLGKFRDQNGVGSQGSFGNYIGAIGDSCFFGDCGLPVPGCPENMIQMGPEITCQEYSGYQALCCPLSIAPDPSFCQWNIGQGDAESGLCLGGCQAGQTLIAESQYPNLPGSGTVTCLHGVGEYCCNTEESLASVCGFEDVCLPLDGNNVPIGACQTDSDRPQYMTYEGGAPQCDGSHVKAYCCPANVPANSCGWYGRENPQTLHCDGNFCSSNQVQVGSDKNGGGFNCMQGTLASFHGSVITWQDIPLALCCNAGDLSINRQQFPFDVNNLFPGGVLSTDQQTDMLDFNTVVGDGFGGEDPNENAFGFAIMSGPSNELTSFDKRDGSHWELYDCPDEKHDGRQTVKALCTDDSIDSNCGLIFNGWGVEDTIVELPPGCSMGRYAVARSLKRTKDPNMPQKLVKRGLGNKAVYDFTFDYNFNTVQKRGSSVRVRIDYTNMPGYWDSIILPPGDENSKKKRDLEIKEVHGGSYKRWLEAEYRKDKRNTPDHKLHELEKKYFSPSSEEWWTKLKNIDLQDIANQLVPHESIEGDYTIWIVDENLQCGNYQATLKIYANTHYQVTIDTGVSLIGTIADLGNWQEANAYMRVNGTVKVTFVFDALGQFTYTTGQVELFGLNNFGSPFAVPGIVTIGPNFRILGELSGLATLHAGYVAEFDALAWDYTLKFPAPGGVGEQGSYVPETDSSPPWAPLWNPPTVTWDVTATGQLVAHIIPRAELGIVFATSALDDTVLTVGADIYARAYANATVSNSVSPTYCYGVDGGVDIFASITTPTIFGYNYNQFWTLFSRTATILQAYCAPIGSLLNGGEPGTVT